MKRLKVNVHVCVCRDAPYGVSELCGGAEVPGLGLPFCTVCLWLTTAYNKESSYLEQTCLLYELSVAVQGRSTLLVCSICHNCGTMFSEVVHDIKYLRNMVIGDDFSILWEKMVHRTLLGHSRAPFWE